MIPHFAFRRVGTIPTATLFIALVATRVFAGPVQPVFKASNFAPNAPINHPFFPLAPGTVFTYEGQAPNPDTGVFGLERETDTVTNTTKQVGGVAARVVSVRTFFEGSLIEDTKDYYAQDKSGNVWYLGEDTKSFQRDASGHIINTDTSGTWHTGVHGAQPGFIMPANPQVVGFSYFQENAPADDAIDQAETAALNASITVPAGHFNHVLKTLETSPLEPGVKEDKFYASGVGTISIWEDLMPNGQPTDRIELISVTHGPAAIPLPPAAWTGLAM